MGDVHKQTLDAEHSVGKHLKWMCDTAPGGRLQETPAGNCPLQKKNKVSKLLETYGES